MLVIAYLTLFVALTISATAIFYSVTGLTAIFAAAAIPIIVMGTALEVAKLVCAVWLHRHWHEAPRYIRLYLSFAVLVLMLITSIGIFGFLSAAHIEQTAASGSQAAKLERVEAGIAEAERRIERARQAIAEAQDRNESDGAAVTERIEALRTEMQETRNLTERRIADQRERLERAGDRLAARLEPHKESLDQIDQQIAQLDSVIQGLIQMDYLSRAQERQAEQKPERDRLNAERATIVERIEEIRTQDDPDARDARARIADLQAEERETIERLRARIAALEQRPADAAGNTAEHKALIATQRAEISDARAQIDALSDRRFDLQADIRKLEAEVGPIKYIAAFVYGESAEKQTLESAVRWVIVIIIIVFDPLAVLMLIASQWSFMEHARRHGRALPGHPAPPAAAGPSPASAPRVGSTSSASPASGTAPRRTDPTPAASGRTPEPAPAADPAPAASTADQPAASGATDDPDAQAKAELIARAQEGKRKPSPRAKGAPERDLADALARFTDPQKSDFDKTFTQHLRTIAPASWISGQKKG